MGGEKWRHTDRQRPGTGGNAGPFVHSRGQARMRRGAAQRRLSAECAMAGTRQRRARDEFETYEWWRKLASRTNRLRLRTRDRSSIVSAGGRDFRNPVALASVPSPPHPSGVAAIRGVRSMLQAARSLPQVYSTGIASAISTGHRKTAHPVRTRSLARLAGKGISGRRALFPLT
jgi:ribosomal protein L32E